MRNKNIFKLLATIVTLGFITIWLKKKGIIKFQCRKISKNPLSPRSVGINKCHKKLAQLFDKHKTHAKTHSYWILPLLVFSILSSDFFEEYAYMFRASLIELTPTEFTGTTVPIEKVPDWANLSDVQRKMTYAQLPKSKLIPIPDYNIANMKAGMEWGKGTDLQRNTYITYPVPHLGNYMLDGTENSGSHTGIDIKAPIGTPVRAISNGVVFKAENQTSGFGWVVSIAHVGIPDPDNPEKNTTLYSNYAHMSKILVREGEEVTKGQVIGKVGESGFATTPHLHFQIDRRSAPFHPYWPFQWKDVQAAGYNSYFDGVKHGVGKTNAEEYTTHPITFITKNTNYIAPNLVASTETIIIPEPKTEPEKIVIETVSDEEPIETVIETKTEERHTSEPEIISTEIVVASELPADLIEPIVRTDSRNRDMTTDDITFETDRTFIPGEEKIITLKINEDALVASNGIEISSSAKYLTQVNPSKLYESDFKNNEAKLRIKMTTGSTFKLIASGDFGEVKSKSFRAQVFSDVPNNHKYSEAIKYLKNNKIVNGYPDGSFKPEGTLNRAEAVKILLEGNNISTFRGETQFPDVLESSWFYKYVTTAADLGIVKGYGPGDFKP